MTNDQLKNLLLSAPVFPGDFDAHGNPDASEALAQCLLDWFQDVWRTLRVPCLPVEYDPRYFGGNYSKVGRFAYLPHYLVNSSDGNTEQDKIANAAKSCGHSFVPENIVHYNWDEPVDIDGEFLEEA